MPPARAQLERALGLEQGEQDFLACLSRGGAQHRESDHIREHASPARTRASTGRRHTVRARRDQQPYPWASVAGSRWRRTSFWSHPGTAPRCSDRRDRHDARLLGPLRASRRVPSHQNRLSCRAVLLGSPAWCIGAQSRADGMKTTLSRQSRADTRGRTLCNARERRCRAIRTVSQVCGEHHVRPRGLNGELVDVARSRAAGDRAGAALGRLGFHLRPDAPGTAVVRDAGGSRDASAGVDDDMLRGAHHFGE
eukprot:scaffold71189_cov31-Tisochrysis_lutea.AAC.1